MLPRAGPIVSLFLSGYRKLAFCAVDQNQARFPNVAPEGPTVRTITDFISEAPRRLSAQAQRPLMPWKSGSAIELERKEIAGIKKLAKWTGQKPIQKQPQTATVVSPDRY